MNKLSFTLFFILFSTLSLQAQHHDDNWVHKDATDTTIVRCWNDSITHVSFPPGSMMGIMFPDSIYCRIDKMHLDSLAHPHDSTYIGWYRFQIGRDSMNFDMMNDSMISGNHMMQFMQDVRCELHWDSLMTDSMHQSWHPTGVHGWNGTRWILIANVTINGSNISFTATQQYSAYAFVGASGSIVGVEENGGLIRTFTLDQNFPNPFNPSTKITFSVPGAGLVSLGVFDMLGRKIATLVNERKEIGDHTLEWNAEGVPSGIYFYRITTGGFVGIKKMILLR